MICRMKRVLEARSQISTLIHGDTVPVPMVACFLRRVKDRGSLNPLDFHGWSCTGLHARSKQRQEESREIVVESEYVSLGYLKAVFTTKFFNTTKLSSTSSPLGTSTSTARMELHTTNVMSSDPDKELMEAVLRQIDGKINNQQLADDLGMDSAKSAGQRWRRFKTKLLSRKEKKQSAATRVAKTITLKPAKLSNSTGSEGGKETQEA
jgi:hypothetical protein